MAGTTVETVWYRNTEHDTIHEVVKGSDLEKRLRREQRQVGDEDDDVEPAYERITEAVARKNPEKQPGYLEQKPATPVQLVQVVAAPVEVPAPAGDPAPADPPKA
jgi:hypothetical protein